MTYLNTAVSSGSSKTISLRDIPERKAVVINSAKCRAAGSSEHVLEDERQVSIAVMGATGSGKTTFINKASGGNLTVGMGLESCTGTVELAPTFELDGYQVTLIDTPGFDDTSRSDMDILETITSFLAKQYIHGKKLAGILYFHRISDTRMGGISRRNFRVFRELCGEETLRNMIIVTNMWGSVAQDVAESREVELINNEAFFKSALDKGAQIVRHDNTPEMAREILRHLVEKKSIPLRIQIEMVEQGKDVSQTASAEELDQIMNAEIKKHREAVRTLQENMKDTLRAQDEECRRRLEEESGNIQAEIDNILTEGQRLASQLSVEKELLEKQMEENRRAVIAQAESQHREMDALHRRLQQEAHIQAAQAQELQRQLDEARTRCQTMQSGGGGCLIM
ncbi:hypothetical protein WG66_004632 [Moniliophthora roreri]|nr:hypothetical protein WG66_004632 [Moniliophthora roreri]